MQDLPFSIPVEELVDALENLASSGIPPTGSISYFDIGSKEYLAYIQNELFDQVLRPGGATCRFYEGPYGAGKTHLLAFIEDRALRNGMAVARADLSQAMGLEHWNLLVRHVLETIRCQINGEIYVSAPEVLAALGPVNPGAAERVRRSNMPHAGFRNAISYALQGHSLDEAAWHQLSQFVSGHNVKATDLKRAGFQGIKAPLKPRNAEQVLKSVLQGLKIAGVPGIVLMFDENEKTLEPGTRGPTKKQNFAANLMRRLIDSCINDSLPGTLVIFTVLPGFLERCALHYQALGQRLAFIRDRQFVGGWRWPVLNTDDINSIRNPEDFLNMASNRMIEAVNICCGDVHSLDSLLKEEGTRALESNAGSGYRRDLMKALASMACQRL